MKTMTIRNLATWFGLGDMPKAPGTFGTLGGIPLYIGISFLRNIFPNITLYNSFYFMFLMTFFALSVYVADVSEKVIFKKEDPQQVVIDEVLGYMTTLFLVNPVGLKEHLIAIVLAFVIFRFLDITKIGPIDKVQELKDGIGVTMDDFLAGVIGNFILLCIWTFFF